MAKYQSLSILCLFSFSLLLPLNPANCDTDTPPPPPPPPSEPEKSGEGLGPWGNKEPDNIVPWTFIVEEGETIESLLVWSADIIDAIGFTIRDENGHITTKVYGNVAGGRLREEKFKAGETIIQISGVHGRYTGNSRRRTISRLIIGTNVNPAGYGPYGRGGGTDAQQFRSRLLNADTFNGLTGTLGDSTRFLESIGLKVKNA